MGSESLLRAACEKAFSVARDSYEADPSIEPPESMRSFLYVARLPRRAITVAQKALEGDEAFRGRVAAAVTPEEVGKAGYIWLHRPDGWEAEFEKLKQDADAKEVKQAVGASGSVSRRQSPTIPPPPGFEPGQFANEPGQTKNGNATSDSSSETEDDMGDVNAIEHELSSLRGLVDRLANERQSVNTDEEKPEGAPLMPSSDGPKAVSSGNGQQMQADLDKAIRDRDEARRKHSESLTHQLELEKELTKLRQGQSIVDAAQAESDGRLVEARKELARVTANRDEAERQRKATVEQMTGLNNEINRLRGEMKASAATATQLEAEIAEHVSEKKTAQDDLEQAGVRAQRLVVTNEDLSRRLVESEQEIERLRVELDGFADLARRSETLQAEAEDLADQLANERNKVKTVEGDLATSHSRIDQLINEVNEVKSDRDGVAQQVGTLQESLGEALTDLSESRVSRDAERISTQEYRAERDELRVELARLQEIDNEQSAKLDELVAEQSAHASLKQRSAELEERVVELDVASSKLKTDLTRVVSERDKVTDQLKSQTEELETLRSDVGRLNQESSSSTAALEKAEGSLEEVRVERETLATQLAEAEQRVTAADAQANKFQEQLEEALSNLGTIQTQIENQQAEIESSTSQLVLERERADEYKIAAETHEKALQALTNQSHEDREAAKGTTAELEAAKEQADQANKDLSKAKKELENSQKELQKSGGELSKTQEELRKAKVELGNAQNELAKAKADVEDATKQLDEQKSALASQPENVISTHVAATRDVTDQVSSVEDTKRDANDTQEVPAADASTDPTPASIDPGELLGLKVVEGDPKDEASDADEASDITVQADDPKTESEISDGSGVASLIRSVPDEDRTASSSDSTDGREEPKSKSLRPPSVLDNEAEEDDKGGNDELDELSNLLSQKVTSFPGSEDAEDSDSQSVDRDDVTFFGERSGEGEGNTIGRPPSVFSTGELVALQAAENDEDSDVTFQPPSDTPISAISPLKSPSDDDDTSLVSNDRRKVEIPAEIASRGGVELARFVVESPEIVLLVDGDGVAKMGWSSRTVGEQREALVSWLADLTASTGASSDVVFDGRLGDDTALPASRVVSIRLSTPPTEPAAALDELVDAYPPQFPIAVVTDNAALKDAAQERGAVALSNAQLLDLFTPE